MDPKIQAWSGHLQSNEFLLQLSVIIDRSLIPLLQIIVFGSIITLMFTKEKNSSPMVRFCHHDLFNGC